MFKRIILRRRRLPLLILGLWAYSGGYALAEPNTGNNARSPKCEAEYQQCAKNCENTQIDVGNQIQLCKDKCAQDTDLYCSRTLTRDGTIGTLPKASVGTLQNVPAAPLTKTPPTNAAPKAGANK